MGFTLSRQRNLARPLGFALLGLILLWSLPRLWVELAWFHQFSLTAVLLRRWGLQLLAFFLVLGLGIPLQLNQLKRCWKLRRSGEPMAAEAILLPLRSWPLSLALLLMLALLVGNLAYLLVQAKGLINQPFSDAVLSGLPMLADLPAPVVLALALGLPIPLIRWPLTSLRLVLAAALVASATALARGWSLWLPSLLAASFGQGDPITGLDLSFTVLRLPALRLVLSVLMAQGLVGLAACLWLCISQGSSLSDWNFIGLSRQQQRVLRPQLAFLALVGSLLTALAPFELMVGGSGVAAGAGFVDLHVRLPLRLLLALLLLFTAVGLTVPLPKGWLRRGLLLPLAGTALLTPLVEGLVAPLVQRLMVQPRELQLEGPYLLRNIRATRAAFGLEKVRLETLEPRQQLTRADLAQAQGTIDNIRLWDDQPLLAANRQLQQLRLFYVFPEATVDRYPLSSNPSRGSQQVLVAARELDTSALPPRSRTWLNRHLVFTHGYGFTVSPVNAVSPDGLPQFFVKDLGRGGQVQGLPQLDVSTASARKTLPVGSPQLYFGTAAANYVVAPTKVREFDFAEGELNFYTTYSGNAGISLANPLERLMAASYLQEPRLLFTGSLTKNSKLLLRRQVRSRLKAMAPFLRFEKQPYLVSVNVPDGDGYRSSQHQYWILDSFTTSRSYPYSEANKEGIRYFRSPVKAVIDAQNGRVWLYVTDPSDPLLRTWQRAFPELFRDLSVMPENLKRHLRVPLSQFEVQAERLLKYHVTDVRTFYNGDDVWSVPTEIYGSSSVMVRPYHVTLQLPGERQPEFVLLLPFSPLKRPNLVSWLAARNDGDSFGELRLVRFPQQRLLLGPQQISALIEQDPVISRQFGLWNREGSRVIQGNLLVIPIGKGLLYVEPIYLRATTGGLPTLVRVVVTDGRRFVMEKNLQQALQLLVKGQ
jgi:uncharacterized membrane protein (UPF0182 family)